MLHHVHVGRLLACGPAHNWPKRSGSGFAYRVDDSSPLDDRIKFGRTTMMPSDTPPPQPTPISFSFTSTCDLYDTVLDLARVPSGLRWRSYGKIERFAGRVVTVQCAADNSRIKETLASPPPQQQPSVLVVDGSGSQQRCALIGDQIAQSAIDNGWAGIVIVGCVRDVEILEMMNIGIVALGSTPRKSTRRGEGQVNERIQVGECQVNPGDVVFVDRNGVLFLDPSDVPAA